MRQPVPVHPANRGRLGHFWTVFSGAQAFHAAFGEAVRHQPRADFLGGGGLEGRDNNGPAFGARDAPHDCLAHLAEVHAGVQPGEGEDNLHRGAIGQVRHLIIGQDLAHHAFGAMAVGELISRLRGIGIIQAVGAGYT